MSTLNDGFIDPPILATSLFAITPSDTVPIREPYKYLFIGGTGNLVIKNAVNELVTYIAVAAGTRLPIAPSFVMATGTTATNLIAEK